MDRILVAVDGSEAALKAVGFAAKLAADTKAELAILTVLDEVYVADRALREFAHSEHLAATWGDLSEARATEILIGAHQRAASHGDPRVRTERRTGNPVEEIVRFAKDSKSELIVVGHVGRSRVAGVLLGSVVFKLLGLAPCPLTVVR
jgi:nucleotide-binding universal stress UspA family protein